MSAKKTLFPIITIAFVAGVFLLLRHLPQPAGAPLIEATQQNTIVALEPNLGYADNAISSTDQPKPAMSQTEKLQSYFNSRFDGKLDNPYWQLKLIEDMLQLFKGLYPDTWQEEMLAFILSAYPELADVLIQKLEALNEYMQWMASLEHSMEFTDDEDRIRAMWDKRLALFGQEAYVIWEAAYKDQQFEKSMSSLQNSSVPFAQKVEEYKAIFTQVHGVDVSSEKQKHKTQIMTRFLSLNNVQSDLKDLPAAERHEQLRAFRQSMGLDEAALDRWQVLDKEREQQRVASQSYSKQHAELENKLSGDALIQAVTALQNQLFGEKEATFIRNEEASGFYRFEQQQQYGVN